MPMPDMSWPDERSVSHVRDSFSLISLRPPRPILALGAGAAGLAAGPAQARPPMWFFDNYGAQGRQLEGITWGLLLLSVAVVAIITLLVAVGLVLRARRGGALRDDRDAVRRRDETGAMTAIYFGLGLTTAVLIAFTVWTMDTLANVRVPPAEPAFTIEVTGRQWWWQVRYIDPQNPERDFQTANEIHVPVGRPVKLLLKSDDVIHTFWVPALGGKTDMIPGQTNAAWLLADKPGIYRGQCNEYCGLQHANMAFRVFADPPAEFDAWWEAQRQPAPEPRSPLTSAGQDVFVKNCGVCHTVRGTIEKAQYGPDLTHLAARSTLGAGIIPNNEGYLSGWISNPQGIKPGVKMPAIPLSGSDFTALRAYLATLE